MKRIIYLFVLMSFALNSPGQSMLYLEEVYDDIQVTRDIEYGQNATVLYVPFLGEAIKEPLLLDLYEPVGEPIIRPLIIYFHSGNFLPFPDNMNVVGTRRDSSVVALCKRLAKCGYVVASADYRLGWNPVASSVDERKLGLINAAYRGVQDANTCIRYFKRSMVEQFNPYCIDTSRIVLWGDDSGGYLTLHAGCLDTYEKIPSASDGKFLLPDLSPMVVEYLNGDVEAKEYGINTPKEPHFPFPEGDTLCYPNHQGYSSKFSVTVNMSGGVGDTAWIDPGQPPVISVHAPYDLTTPYDEGIVYVFLPPVTYLEVVEVQGSSVVSYLTNYYGNNESLGMPDNATPFQIAVSEHAYTKNGGLDGLYPIYGDTITDATPWVFWDCSTNVNCENGLYGNPHMTFEKAQIYMDTILAYVLPRLYKSLDLGLPTKTCVIATEELLESDILDIAVSPNPTFEEITITTEKDYPIINILLYDMKGTLLNQYADIKSTFFQLPVNHLVPGQYILKFQFDQGVAARLIVVQ